ncbi:flavodoxin [Lachnoclostridium sp. An131]|uniref:flavodoxin n=1 Tax=Lachnoclostridium sp. An131 TaxID=1965555 RepID=UPI000B375CA4|nr:flavodoxin [Lachnoclostridium sp. An131]OUQ23485.1 flavodoxin [Lachnoclostridium sp. An131]
MKKKTLAMLLTLAMTMGLAACGSSEEASAETVQEETAETEESTETEEGTETEEQQTAEESGEQEADAAEEKSADSQESAQESDEHVLIAYFSVPEDVDTEGVDAVAGASIVVRDGEVLGNLQYMADVIQETVGGDIFRIETAQEYPLDHEPLVDQAAEEQDADARPELSTQIENLDQYDTILLGFPNWWGDMPMPLYTFLEEYDFSGKTIIPFTAHGGSGFSNTVNTIAELQPDAEVREDGLSISRSEVAGAEEEISSWAAGLGL